MDALACNAHSGQNLSPIISFLLPVHLLLAANSIAAQYIYLSVHPYLISNIESSHSRTSSSTQVNSLKDRLSRENLTWGVELEFVYAFHESELQPVLTSIDSVKDTIQKDAPYNTRKYTGESRAMGLFKLYLTTTPSRQLLLRILESVLTEAEASRELSKDWNRI